jgi:hypothetical protein
MGMGREIAAYLTFRMFLAEPADRISLKGLAMAIYRKLQNSTLRAKKSNLLSKLRGNA